MKSARSSSRRPVRRPALAAALVRAALLAGPLGAAIAFGVAPNGRGFDRQIATNAPDGLDVMSTGSISGSRFTFSVGSSGFSDCLRFPDGSQRGGC